MLSVKLMGCGTDCEHPAYPATDLTSFYVALLSWICTEHHSRDLLKRVLNYTSYEKYNVISSILLGDLFIYLFIFFCNL